MRNWYAGLIAVVLLPGMGISWNATSGRVLAAQVKEAAMHQAKGTFEPKVVPAELSEFEKGAGFGRMTIDKIYSGAVQGSAKGEMLTSITEATGAMAYVAVEHVTASLDGRSGGFALTHSGTMMRNNPAAGALKVNTVPGSGTGELTGISGTMAIVIDSAGKHSYTFDYTLP